MSLQQHNGHVLEWKWSAVHTMTHNHPINSDTNNCTVRAVANAFGWSMVRSYHHLERHGRKHRRGPSWGAYRTAVKAACKATGRKLVDEAVPSYGKTIKTLERRLTASETVIVNVRGHTLSYRNQYTNDWAESRRHHVNEVWRITNGKA